MSSLTIALGPDGTIVIDGDPFATGSPDAAFGGFMALFVLFAIVGIGVAIYKIWWAGELARRRGNDPGEAMLTSFLTGDEGTAAAYMRADRVTDGPTPPTPPRTQSVEQRLRELDALRAQGLVSDAEAATKRTEILGDL
jgi:hypothetical protein